MDKLNPLKHALQATGLAICCVIVHGQAAAADPSTKSPIKGTEAASAPAASKGALNAPKTTVNSSLANKTGDNQYPGTAPAPPRPPKKEALEAAGAAKAKAGQ